MTVPAPPSPVESTTDGASFEAMFTRTLKPEGTFLEELRAVGFDPRSYRGRMPTRIWHACLDVARRHTFPTHSVADGYHRLGLLFMEGYFQTILGRLLTAAMPLVGLERSLMRVPKAWKANQPTLEMTVEKQADRQWRVEIKEKGVLPDFCAGLLEGGAKPIGVTVQVNVLERSPDRCLIQIQG